MTASSPDSTIDSAQRWRKRRFGWVILVLGAMIHAGVISGPVWERVRGAAHGRDFASYYYAVQVAADGEDPYDTRGLSRRARNSPMRTPTGAHSCGRWGTTWITITPPGPDLPAEANRARNR